MKNDFFEDSMVKFISMENKKQNIKLGIVY